MLQQVYQFGLRPLAFSLDPERAHALAMQSCRAIAEVSLLRTAIARLCQVNDPRLHQQIWGLSFANPLGLAAGFDKDAQALGAWEAFGFGFAEVGTISPQPQPGNPLPRLFRLPADRAILNRMGFNNRGADAAAAFLQEYLRDRPLGYPLGINLGKGKDTPLDRAKDDYCYSFERLEPFGDYFTINVSSPNTAGLRDLQALDRLMEILAAVQSLNARRKPILVKIAPDLADADIRELARAARSLGLAGLIATNTTISRDGLQTKILAATGRSPREEAGGISGAPLRSRSTEVIRLIWQETQGQLPIVGVGGIFSADDAWEKIAAGASLLQIYTGWIYEGPLLVRRVLEGLLERMAAVGCDRLDRVVGTQGDLSVPPA